MYEITIIVDTNDADYDTSINCISEENLEKIRPLIIAIKNFKPYKGKSRNKTYTHNHNFPYGEMCRENLGEKTHEEIYSEFSEEMQIFEDLIPYGGEWGFHTITSIEYGPYVKKIKLL